MNSITLSCLFLASALTGQAQLTVPVSPVKTTGQKAIVLLTMTNDLAESVESARAVCFLLDEQGKMAGQSTKWVVGGTKDRPALQPKSGTTFNFVITSPQPFITTNLTAQVSFSRLVLEGEKLANPKTDVQIQNRK
jgi:hypothetical protein